MAKIPDFSELTKKLNVQGLVDSVKSAVGGTPPKAPEGDEVAARFVEVMNMVQDLNKAHAEHEKAVVAIHNKLNAIYKDVQLLRHPAGSTEAGKPATQATDSKTSSDDTTQK